MSKFFDERNLSLDTRQKRIAIVALALATLTTLATGAPTPDLFEPGVISSPANDGAPTFSPDGRTLFFERSNGKRSFIVTSHRVNAGWSKPEIASFAGPWNDQQPAYSPDGRFLVYVSPREVIRDGARMRVSHLYRVERTAKGWSEPKELPAEVNISNRVFKPTVAANGDLYFMSDVGPGVPAPPKWRLFHAVHSADGYRQAEPLPFGNSEASDVDPAVAPDQSYLIFSSQGREPTNDGHEHLFIAFRQGAGWGEPKPIRYSGDDWGGDDGEANISPDGRTLYFTSSRQQAPSADRTRAEMLAAYSRMEIWDNGNSNVWTLPLAPYLAAGQ